MDIVPWKRAYGLGVSPGQGGSGRVGVSAGAKGVRDAVAGVGPGVGVMSVRLAVENPSWSASQKTLMLWMSEGTRNWWMGRSSKVSVMAWNLTAECVQGGVKGELG